jgi:hypothetical protein
MDGRIERYRKEGQGIDLSISDGSDIEKHLKKADFVSITGSTLVNGTLDRLLHLAQGCPKIILQGQSASIHPGVCFASGVHMVATTIKTREVAQAAFWDPTGAALNPLLEGHLPYVYLWPRASRTSV